MSEVPFVEVWGCFPPLFAAQQVTSPSDVMLGVNKCGILQGYLAHEMMPSPRIIVGP